VHKTADVFEKMGAKVKWDFDFDSAHLMPTLDYGSHCGTFTLPGLGWCGKYLAYEALNYMIGPLVYPSFMY